MTRRDSLLIFKYVLYFVYICGKMLKLIAEDIRLNSITNSEYRTKNEVIY